MGSQEQIRWATVGNPANQRKVNLGTTRIIGYHLLNINFETSDSLLI